MGTWNVGPFDNDGAGDLLAGIRHGDFTFESIADLFEDPDYLEVDGGQTAIALAALVQVVQSGLGAPAHVDQGQLTGFAEQLTPERVAWIQAQFDRAISSGAASETYELWEDAGELDEWLRASLTAAGR